MGGGKGDVEPNKAWIGGLPDDYTEDELEKLCSKCGTVVWSKICSNDKDRFAFVEFEDEHSVKVAIDTLDQFEIDDRATLKVSHATKRKDKGDKGGKGYDKGWGKGYDNYRDRSRSPRGRDDGYGKDLCLV